MNKIKIIFDDFSLQAELDNSNTATEIISALPFESKVNTWGDEIYFEIPISVGQAANATDEVEIGSLGYWPVGRAFCIFFGPTPISGGQNPRAASPVNVFGSVIGDLNPLRNVKSGTGVKVKRAE